MTKGINNIQPTRLEQALASRGLSKAQLANLVGVSASTVTKWCKGDQGPEAETFERLASVLNIQAEWFTRQPLAPVTSPLFRSNASALKSARAKLNARVEWVQEITAIFESSVDFPTLNLPEFYFQDPQQISTSDIELAADECRIRWQLGRGAIQDLTLAAESAGIVVAREDTDISAIEGLSCWSTHLDGRPIVLLAADKANGFRSRFDLAHEIGHLVLHKHTTGESDADKHKIMEKQAHQFAGALLLPAESFANEVRVPTNLDNLLILKQRWGASVAAMMMRLHALGMLSDDQKLQLFKRRSARWGAKAEPGDDGWKPEEPRLLRRTVDLLISAGVLTAERLPQYLGFSARDIEKLCGLRANYFEKPAEIVDLSTLRSLRERKLLDIGAHQEKDQRATVLEFKRLR